MEKKPRKAKPQPVDALVELVELLEEIDENSPLAKLNATTISDNNGGRIKL